MDPRIDAVDDVIAGTGAVDLRNALLVVMGGGGCWSAALPSLR